MLRLKSSATLVALLCTLNSFACIDGSGFLPPNNMRIPVSEKTSGLNETQYNAVIDKVVKVFDPIARSYGGELRVDRKWASEVVNAGTYRDEGGRHWHISMYGGFARHPHITEDGFALVMCHEIGHHIGGAPKKVYGTTTIWASTEGQSDYFATLKCLRKIFAQDDNVAVIKEMQIPDNVRRECQNSFSVEWEAALCMRTSMAGLSVARVNAEYRKVPSPLFSQPDPAVVARTVNFHPEPQCRLDTYFQGSLCQVPSSRYVSQTYEAKSTCHNKLGFTRGLRPSCWFKPY